MQASCKKEIFFLFLCRCEISIKKQTAKDISSRIRKRNIELAFGWKSEKYLIYAWILLLILSVILTLIVQNWTQDVSPGKVGADVSVSVRRLDSHRLEVMIISIGKDADIRNLEYSTTHGSGIINRSASPFEPVRDAGEPGIIAVSGYDEDVEIFAVLSDSKIRIFRNEI